MASRRSIERPPRVTLPTGGSRWLVRLLLAGAYLVTDRRSHRLQLTQSVRGDIPRHGGWHPGGVKKKNGPSFFPGQSRKRWRRIVVSGGLAPLGPADATKNRPQEEPDESPIEVVRMFWVARGFRQCRAGELAAFFTDGRRFYHNSRWRLSLAGRPSPRRSPRPSAWRARPSRVIDFRVITSAANGPVG